MTTTRGGYRLGDVIGAGDSGETHYGVEDDHGAAVAIKVVRHELADDPDWVGRLTDLAAVLERIDHPNIVMIDEVLIDAGRVSIVSELVFGTDLRGLLNEEGTLTPIRAARLVGEVLSTLASAHSSGLVHGHLTLENILVASDGQVRITDFGMSSSVNQTSADDVYSCGLVLYELLIGSRPAAEIDANSTRPHAVPVKVWDLLAAMLTVEADERPSAGDLRLRLAALVPRMAMLLALAPATAAPAAPVGATESTAFAPAIEVDAEVDAATDPTVEPVSTPAAVIDNAVTEREGHASLAAKMAKVVQAVRAVKAAEAVPAKHPAHAKPLSALKAAAAAKAAAEQEAAAKAAAEQEAALEAAAEAEAEAKAAAEQEAAVKAAAEQEAALQAAAEAEAAAKAAAVQEAAVKAAAEQEAAAEQQAALQAAAEAEAAVKAAAEQEAAVKAAAEQEAALQAAAEAEAAVKAAAEQEAAVKAAAEQEAALQAATEAEAAVKAAAEQQAALQAATEAEAAAKAAAEQQAALQAAAEAEAEAKAAAAQEAADEEAAARSTAVAVPAAAQPAAAQPATVKPLASSPKPPSRASVLVRLWAVTVAHGLRRAAGGVRPAFIATLDTLHGSVGATWHRVTLVVVPRWHDVTGWLTSSGIRSWRPSVPGLTMDLVVLRRRTGITALHRLGVASVMGLRRLVKLRPSDLKSVQFNRPSARQATRITIVAAVVVVVLAATAAVGKLWFFSDSHPTAAYPFAPASYESGLVVNRTWTLSGDHGQLLQATVTLANSLNGPLSGTFDEVIPKTVAGLDSAVAFNPLPDQVVQSDPIVRYKFYLTRGTSTDVRYSVDIGPSTGSLRTRLIKLASDQATAQAAYLKQIGQPAPATLAAVSVLPNALSLQVGQVLTATVTGVMSNGASAAAAALNGVQWTTADHSVAIVDHATITAVGPGTTTISAEAGGLRADVSVSVSSTAISTPPSSSAAPTTSRPPTTPVSTTAAPAPPPTPTPVRPGQPTAPTVTYNPATNVLTMAYGTVTDPGVPAAPITTQASYTTPNGPSATNSTTAPCLSIGQVTTFTYTATNPTGTSVPSNGTSGTCGTPTPTPAAPGKPGAPTFTYNATTYTFTIVYGAVTDPGIPATPLTYAPSYTSSLGGPAVAGATATCTVIGQTFTFTYTVKNPTGTSPVSDAVTGTCLGPIVATGGTGP